MEFTVRVTKPANIDRVHAWAIAVIDPAEELSNADLVAAVEQRLKNGLYAEVRAYEQHQVVRGVKDFD